MNNTVICVWNSGDKGKSSSIIETYNFLIKKGASVEYSIKNILSYSNPDNNNNEILSVLNYQGLKIGIESQGDPKGRQFQTLPELTKLGCNLIICASRTKNSTCDLVYSLGYDIIWFSNFYFDDDIRNKNRLSSLHNFNGKTIVKLVDDLINGKI